MIPQLLMSLVGVPDRTGEVWQVPDARYAFGCSAVKQNARLALIIAKPVLEFDRMDDSWLFKILTATFTPSLIFCHLLSYPETGATELVPERWLRKYSVRLA